MKKIDYRIAVASPAVLAIAEGLLRTRLDCPEDDRTAIRTLTKALIDEAEESQRDAERLGKVPGTRLTFGSPPETCELARRVLTIPIADEAVAARVERVAVSYLEIAEVNRWQFEDLRRRRDEALRG